MAASTRLGSQPTELPRGTFRPARHVRSVEHAGSTLLCDDKQYYTLPNEVATRIWELLSEGASVVMLMERLHAEFDVPSKQLTGDVAEFLQQLIQLRLIEWEDR